MLIDLNHKIKEILKTDECYNRGEGRSWRRRMKTLTMTFILSTLILSGCLSSKEGGTTVGNPQTASVQLEFSDYTVAKSNLFDYLITPAYAGINNLTFCFKRLRFKLADSDTTNPDTDEDNIDFDLGEVVINPAGTTLGTIELPIAEYKRLEFDLEDHCTSGLSVDLTNDNGNYTSTSRITIKFSGSYTPTDGDVLNLAIQHISDALKNYDGSGADLKDTLEGISGNL